MRGAERGSGPTQANSRVRLRQMIFGRMRPLLPGLDFPADDKADSKAPKRGNFRLFAGIFPQVLNKVLAEFELAAAGFGAGL